MICAWCDKEIEKAESEHAIFACYGRKGKVHYRCKTVSANTWNEESMEKRKKEKVFKKYWDEDNS